MFGLLHRAPDVPLLCGVKSKQERWGLTPGFIPVHSTGMSTRPGLCRASPVPPPPPHRQVETPSNAEMSNPFTLLPCYPSASGSLSGWIVRRIVCWVDKGVPARNTRPEFLSVSLKIRTSIKTRSFPGVEHHVTESSRSKFTAESWQSLKPSHWGRGEGRGGPAQGFLQVIMFKASNQLFTDHIDSSAAASDGEPAPMTVAILPKLSIHLLPLIYAEWLRFTDCCFV